MKALVLSAGGMFGAYQAGAWKVLSRHFQPDLVVGASVGALNGWAIAGGCTPEELIARWCDPAKASIVRMRFPVLPWRGIFDPELLASAARELFSAYRPVIPFAVTVVRLPQFKPEIVRGEHMTWRHLMATCALPGGYAPVREAGLFVDGGLLGILPLWAAAELGATDIVAINAMPATSRLLRTVLAPLRFRRPRGTAPAARIVQPAQPLGKPHVSLRWREADIRRWIEMGEQDAARLV